MEWVNHSENKLEVKRGFQTEVLLFTMDLKKAKTVKQRDQDIVYGYIKLIQSLFIDVSDNPYYIINQLIQNIILLYSRVFILLFQNWEYFWEIVQFDRFVLFDRFIFCTYELFDRCQTDLCCLTDVKQIYAVWHLWNSQNLSNSHNLSKVLSILKK